MLVCAGIFFAIDFPRKDESEVGQLVYIEDRCYSAGGVYFDQRQLLVSERPCAVSCRLETLAVERAVGVEVVDITIDIEGLSIHEDLGLDPMTADILDGDVQINFFLLLLTREHRQ